MSENQDTGHGGLVDSNLGALSPAFWRLMDMDLSVSISLGRAELPLQDVLRLTTGSIIELNRSVGDPVDVVVNDRVVARGEVVVVNGSYGVRVQQLVGRAPGSEPAPRNDVPPPSPPPAAPGGKPAEPEAEPEPTSAADWGLE
jgi:flagellar motor switch protein FliN